MLNQFNVSLDEEILVYNVETGDELPCKLLEMDTPDGWKARLLINMETLDNE